MDDSEIQRMLGANSARLTLLEKSRESFERDMRASMIALTQVVGDIKSSVDSNVGASRAVKWIFGAFALVVSSVLALHQLGVRF